MVLLVFGLPLGGDLLGKICFALLPHFIIHFRDTLCPFTSLLQPKNDGCLNVFTVFLLFPFACFYFQNLFVVVC